MQLQQIELNSYVRPEVKEVSSKKWVLNGNNNEFFQYIIDRYNGSPTNRAIIDSYSQFIYGKGLTSTEKNIKPLQFAMVNQILPKTQLRPIVQDYSLYSESALELIYKKNELKSIVHVATNQVAPNKMNDDGEIELYWYCQDFSKTNKYPPIEIKAWKSGDKKREGSYIYIIKTYQAGRTYYNNPCYLPCLQYAHMEEEISNYYINHIRNGFSAGHIFNMNNGEPQSEEEKRAVIAQLKTDGTGSSNAGKGFINWNESQDTAITITSVEVSEAHKQYELINTEASEKIMIGHRVTSPIMFGVLKTGGLGNNANEMESAFNELMINVIQPKQEVILDSLMEIFVDNGMTINLEFIPLRMPTINQPTATKLSATVTSKDLKCSELEHNIDPIVADNLIKTGEILDLNEWECIDEEEYCENSTELTEISLKLATIPANLPLAPSELDNNYFKVRFEYAGNLNPQREFCQKMMSAGRVYRKEDIDLASQQSVNAGLGPNGSNTYDILKYKGGKNCYHLWIRKVYLKKGNNYITVDKAQQIIRNLKGQGINTEIPTSGEPLSSIPPIKMPNHGGLN